MKRVQWRAWFGCASKCRDLDELISFLKELVGEDAQKAAVAFGMLLSAHSTKGGVYRDDALQVLTALSFAKARLDSAMCHTSPTIDVTSEILSNAQRHAEQLTVPCSEWPTSEDIIENALASARVYANVKEWKRMVRDGRGSIVGVESIEVC